MAPNSFDSIGMEDEVEKVIECDLVDDDAFRTLEQKCNEAIKKWGMGPRNISLVCPDCRNNIGSWPEHMANRIGKFLVILVGIGIFVWWEFF